MTCSTYFWHSIFSGVRCVFQFAIEVIVESLRNLSLLRWNDRSEFSSVFRMEVNSTGPRETNRSTFAGRRNACNACVAASLAGKDKWVGMPEFAELPTEVRAPKTFGASSKCLTRSGRIVCDPCEFRSKTFWNVVCGVRFSSFVPRGFLCVIHHATHVTTNRPA